MKKLNAYILEDFKLNKKGNINKSKSYSYNPKNKYELKQILKERLSTGKDADLNDINVSAITDMEDLFYNLDPHNIDISQWHVSNVKNMSGMFYGCKEFNCDLSDWDVSNVEDMSSMFVNCELFNCDLSNWNVSKVETMRKMFGGCKRFEGKGLENWDVSKVETMKNMFDGCKKFNCDLFKWDVSNVEYNTRCNGFENMFDGCKSLKNKPWWYKEEE